MNLALVDLQSCLTSHFLEADVACKLFLGFPMLVLDMFLEVGLWSEEFQALLAVILQLVASVGRMSQIISTNVCYAWTNVTSECTNVYLPKRCLSFVEFQIVEFQSLVRLECFAAFGAGQVFRSERQVRFLSGHLFLPFWDLGHLQNMNMINGTSRQNNYRLCPLK